jgi:hypothetical protein
VLPRCLPLALGLHPEWPGPEENTPSKPTILAFWHRLFTLPKRTLCCLFNPTVSADRTHSAISQATHSTATPRPSPSRTRCHTGPSSACRAGTRSWTAATRSRGLTRRRLCRFPTADDGLRCGHRDGVQAVAVIIATLRGCALDVARNAKMNTLVVAMSI